MNCLNQLSLKKKRRTKKRKRSHLIRKMIKISRKMLLALISMMKIYGTTSPTR